MTAATTVPSPYDDSQFYDGVVVKRLAAFCIDVVIVTALMGVIAVLGFIVGLLTLGLGWLIAIPLFLAADFLYRWYTIATGSATWGMALCGIELRDQRGERLDAGQALVHTLAYYLTIWLAVPLILSLAVLILSPHRRLLHDFALNTVAINRPM